MIVGIVAEGPTDVVILEEFLSERLKNTGVSAPLEIRPLQPAVDATSGAFEDGGWTWVRAWCANNPPEHRAVDLFQPLFEGDRPLDILIVQVDGDAVGKYAKPYPHIPVPMNPDARARGQIVEAVLEEWLWGGSQGRGLDPRCVEALSGGRGPGLGDLDCRWNGSIHTESGGSGPRDRADADCTSGAQDQNAPRPQEAGQETGFLAKAGTTGPAASPPHRVRLSSLREVPAMRGDIGRGPPMTPGGASHHDMLDVPSVICRGPSDTA